MRLKPQMSAQKHSYLIKQQKVEHFKNVAFLDITRWYHAATSGCIHIITDNNCSYTNRVGWGETQQPIDLIIKIS